MNGTHDYLEWKCSSRDTWSKASHQRDDPPKVTEQERLQLLWPPVKDDELIGPLRCWWSGHLWTNHFLIRWSTTAVTRTRWWWHLSPGRVKFDWNSVNHSKSINFESCSQKLNREVIHSKKSKKSKKSEKNRKIRKNKKNPKNPKKIKKIQ